MWIVGRDKALNKRSQPLFPPPHTRQRPATRSHLSGATARVFVCSSARDGHFCMSLTCKYARCCRRRSTAPCARTRERRERHTAARWSALAWSLALGTRVVRLQHQHVAQPVQRTEKRRPAPRKARTAARWSGPWRARCTPSTPARCAVGPEKRRLPCGPEKRSAFTNRSGAERTGCLCAQVAYIPGSH